MNFFIAQILILLCSIYGSILTQLIIRGGLRSD